MPILALIATAGVVLRGFVRGQGLVAAAAVALVSLGSGMALAEASLGHEGRLEADLAWAAAEVLGWFLALTHGAGLSGLRGILGAFTLARPVAAGLLLAGRFLGLAAGLFFYVAVVNAVVLAWLWIGYGAAWVPVLGMGWLLWLRLLVVLGVSTVFLALVRPSGALPLAALSCAAGWFAGSVPPAAGPHALKPFAAVGSVVLPDFRALDAPLAGLPAGVPEAASMLAGSTLYAALYTTGVVAAAVAIFPWAARRFLRHGP